ncbi:hypothetical protein L6164_017952 [Bauhinia variegata]|uniref:Uncharacterized protein n=1 Tax=Bauhinia variegata TaxID=167791 RepID=A0ACB9NAA5_BAUVA|nr:hypothetical protein L6164_017952 [Bauhinia variegata]
MKRLRSSDDLHSYGDKNVFKDSNLNRSSSSHRGFYYKSDNVRKGLISSSSSSSRYDRDRTVDDDRDSSRLVRKRSDHDFEGFDRRKGFERYRDGGDSRGYGSGGDRNSVHRSESFCGTRREFPKGFRSERDRSRREGTVSSWRRFGGIKDFDDTGRGSRVGLEDRGIRSPKGLKDVKSPTRSKDSESEQSKMRSPPRGWRDSKSKSKSKSPSWSKDSESEQSKSEQSKSVEVKKTEEVQVESGSSSEMEEGELEPEPMPEAESDTAKNAPENEDRASTRLDIDEKEAQNECQVGTSVEETSDLSDKQRIEPNEDFNTDEKDVVKEVDKLPDVQVDPANKMHIAENENETVPHDDDKEKQPLKVDIECKEETQGGADVEEPLFNEEEHKQDKDVNLETRVVVDNPEFQDHHEASTENEVPEVNSEMIECVPGSAKDKGKGVSVTPTDVHSSEDGLWTDRGLRDLTTCSDDAMEGPSTRGFELFSRSPVRKVETTAQSNLSKQKDGSLGMEQLDLSLSLPNVLLPIGAHETTQVPGSPSQARSVQSLSNTFRTNSDGFTASMSFSGSQSFYHNPSCSLTQNSLDYEQSVGSRPLFQNMDQLAQGGLLGQPQNDSKLKDFSFGQRTSVNGSGSIYQPQASWGISDSQAMKGQHSRVLEGSPKTANGLDRQLSFYKQLSGQSRHHDDVRSPSQSVGSHDIGSSYSFGKKREMRDRSNGSLYRTASQKEHEQFLMGSTDSVETMIARIVSDPVHAMAKKFHEMTGQSLMSLKEGIREILLNADKHGQVLAFQKVLQNRSDITLEVLLKSHRVQLEIMVALKTGLTDFLHLDSSISSSDLAEIFLNLRCRNLTCRSQLPVDECDCKVCVLKNGFCRECMCLACSKFDMASNTCSWVGCDVCLHWCHADCGLRESYIRNGHSANGAQGTTEMQFHCIACDHPSEMFGFVKEVFQNFAKEWSVEAFRKEVEYVKRIFSASKDMRGRQLHGIAERMLSRLADKSNLPEVYSYIMSFLSDGDSSKLAMTQTSSVKEQVKENKVLAGSSQEAPWLKSVYSEKPPLLERPVSMLPIYDRDDKRTHMQDLQLSIPKDFCFDELESIVKIKHAEAKMFQGRADDARREAEGLKRIALAKNEKIEEEYTNRIAKLRLGDAEEMRKRKLEELQALERVHLEYFNMKMRMEADIKDLLSKMEAIKRSPAM